jgi:uncharacterized membrane protein
VLGPRLGGLDLPLFKVIVGTLLVLFGLRWLRKATLRAAGVLALHDEAKSFAKKSNALRAAVETGSGFDLGAAATAFNGVLIEGIEVVFIVLAVGATGGRLAQATLGAGIAAVAVIALGVIARHPLTRIPENVLKMTVGVLVSSFGTFWIGEGLHIAWPGGDYALVLLAAGYFAVVGLGVVIARVCAGLRRVSESTEKKVTGAS